jgi:hypothetical protein
MTIDMGQTARGALAGAVAAGVWAAQSPLDSRMFGVAYLDQELLGKWVTRGRGWHPVGWALHLANGALFGAVYANLAPRLPLPVWARGPAAGLAEHLATWPLVPIVDRVHPARDDLPALSGSARAFAQATWRHVLFGAVVGELERRLNVPGDDSAPVAERTVSSNGHGNIEHAVGSAR